MPNGADNEKLIQIIEPNKTVNGLTWDQFHQAMAQKGYPNAENDNHLRSVFNLAGEDHPEIAFHAEQMLSYDGAPDANFRERSEERVLQLVEQEVLNPARLGQEYVFDENQRETILYCERALNESGKGQNEYAFEDYHPRPEEPQAEEPQVEEPQVEEPQVEEPQVEEPEPEELQQEDIEEPQPEELQQEDIEEPQPEELHPEELEEEAPQQEQQQQGPQQAQQQQQGPQQAQQQPQNPQPANRDAELAHNVTLYNEMYRDMETAYNRLEDETVGVPFGSSQYSKAMKDVKKVSDTWADLKEKDLDYQLSDHELELARQQVYEAQESVNEYLAKKERERNGKSLSTESGASFYRQEAMLDAKKTLQAQADALDEIAARRGMERPLPSDEKLARQRKNLENDLEDATRNVHNGSNEYKDAQTKFQKLNELWDKTLANKAEGELPSPGEIENLRANIEQTRQATDIYLDKKADLNNPKAKTEKRISTMSRVRENLEIQEKKLAEWEKKLAEQEPVKSYKDLADNTTYLKEQMAAADKGVVGGSKEFKEVNDLLKKQEEKWKEFEKKGPDYKMTPDELREMVEMNQKIEKSVNKYIADKAGKNLSEKTQKRLRVMQKVKNHTLSQRKKFEARRDEMLKEVEGISNQQIEKENKDISLNMRNATRKVYFGSKEYKNAMRDYNRSLSSWKDYQAKEAAGTATYDERNAQYKSIQDNIKSIDKYLDSKKGKDLSKHPKMQKRVEIMQKARENLQIRMRKIELAHEKQMRAEKEATRQQTQARRTQLQSGIRSRKSLERDMSKASMAATKKLAELGSKKTLSDIDKKNARTALAALVIENIIRQPGNEQLKAQLSKGGKEYSKIVRAFANSKDFKKAFPDKMFTPNNVKNLATNPRSVERCTNHLFGQEVNRQQNMQQQRQLQQQRQNTKNTQMENTRNK